MKPNHIKHPLIPIISGIFLIAFAAPTNAAVILVGWETWSTSTTAASVAATGVTGSASTGGANVTWAIGSQAASTDGTFGSVSGASTSTGAANSGILVWWNPAGSTGHIDFTITATTVRLELEGFHFDSKRKRAQSPTTWSLSVLSGDITNGNVSSGGYQTGALGGVGPSDHDDFDIDLTGLADNVLEIGQSATFRLSFSGGNPTNNDQMAYLDNVAITGIPEPASALLGSLGLLALLRRRRT